MQDELSILIHQKLTGIGIKDYHRKPVILLVSQPEKQVKLGNDIYFLNNYILDVPVTARLQLESPDNLFITSKIDYETLTNYKHQAFSEALIITLRHYGLSFTPFQLEFEKVTPLI